MIVIKNMLIVMGTLALIAVAVIGWKPAYSYLRSGSNSLKKSIQKNIPFDVEMSRLEQMVDDLNRVIHDYERTCLEKTVDFDMLKETLEVQKEDLKRQKKDLLTAGDLLKTDKKNFEISSKSFTREEVSRDLKKRLDVYESHQKMMGIRVKTLSTLQNALAEAKIQLKKMKEKKLLYLNELQLLRAQHLRVEAKKELAETVSGLSRPDLESDFSEVKLLFSRLNHRLKVENEMLTGLSRTGSFEIDYNHEKVHEEDVLKRLQTTLKAE
jgi:hypothetical protein